MPHLIYIGRHTATIEHFSKIVKGAFYAIQNSKRASEFTDKIRGKYDTATLFEERDLPEDIPEIQCLRKKFPGVYIVLVTERVNKEDRPVYLKVGISNSMSFGPTSEAFKNMSELMIRRKQQKISDINEKRSNSQAFRLPLWKRLFDITFSLIAILCLSPILLITALTIQMESKGAVVYKSKRVGSNYKVSDLLKFRSIYTDADKHLGGFNQLNQYQAGREEQNPAEEELLISGNMELSEEEIMLIPDDFVISEQSYANKKSVERKNAFVKLENNPRITKVGHTTRKYSIDELPQLINILKGDISIADNRPLPLYEVELLTSDEYIDRFMGPAGLTGLWQVERRGSSGKMSTDERKQLDIKYAKTFSFQLDMKIILRTFMAFIQKENV